MLPKLHTVYLIVGLSEVGQQAELVEALRAEAAALGRSLRVDGNPVTIQAQQVTDSDQEALVDFLRPFAEQAGAWVDITGGTKTMSIAVARGRRCRRRTHDVHREGDRERCPGLPRHRGGAGVAPNRRTVTAAPPRAGQRGREAAAR